MALEVQAGPPWWASRAWAALAERKPLALPEQIAAFWRWLVAHGRTGEYEGAEVAQ